MNRERNLLIAEYDKYRAQCRTDECEPMTWGDWLEEMAINAAIAVDTMARELDQYRNAAQTNHEHWQAEKKQREMYETTVDQLHWMLAHGQYDEAVNYIGAVTVWN